MPLRLIALIDLDEPYARAFREAGARHGFAVATASGSSCSLSNASFGVVGVRGEAQAAPERMRAIRKALGKATLVVVAQEIGINAAVGLMRAGAADVIEAPAPPAEIVARALARSAPDRDEEELLGESPALRALRAEIAAIAPMRSTVLITGETGVGKGVAARLIHRLSGRPDRPFVHVDCSALAASVIESELFGHERGSFTGAVGSRAGRFEVADDGTIFLDEIGELEPNLQTKLLRVLQDREYERLGGSTTRLMTARVVAATNRDLRAAVTEGRFRADLLFRLNVFHLRIPPLRERAADVPLLARSAVGQIAERLQMEIPPLDPSFYEELCRRGWPGNVRELMNVLERMLVRHQAGIEDDPVCADGFDATPAANAPPELGDDLDGAGERFRLESVLRSVGGNISRAARRLGVPRTTLRYQIRINGLSHLIPRD